MLSMYVLCAKEYAPVCVQCITRHVCLAPCVTDANMCFQYTCTYAMRRSTCLRCVYSVLRGSMRCRCKTCASNVHVRTLCEGVHACVVCTVYMYYEVCVWLHALPMQYIRAFNVHKPCEGVHARVVCTVYYEVCVWLAPSSTRCQSNTCVRRLLSARSPSIFRSSL